MFSFGIRISSTFHMAVLRDSTLGTLIPVLSSVPSCGRISITRYQRLLRLDLGRLSQTACAGIALRKENLISGENFGFARGFNGGMATKAEGSGHNARVRKLEKVVRDYRLAMVDRPEQGSKKLTLRVR